MIKYLFKSFVFTLLLLISNGAHLYAQTCAAYQAANSTPDPGCDQVVWVTSTADNTSAGTLRSAINSANSWTGTGTSIRFCINTPGEIVFQMSTGLPFVTRKIYIDGTKNITYVNSPIIVLEDIRTNTSTVSNMLVLSNISQAVSADGSTIKGLIFRRMGNAAIATGQKNISITGNIFQGRSEEDQSSAILLSHGVTNITILRNVFGTITSTNNDVVIHKWGDHINPNSITFDVNIGSGLKQDANTFYVANTPAVITQTNSQVPAGAKWQRYSIKYNYFIQTTSITSGTFKPPLSLEVNTTGNPYRNKVPPTITGYNTSTKTVTGTSYPNDRVEVYIGENKLVKTSADICPSAKVYLGVAYANSSGVWQLPSTNWEIPATNVIEYDAINALADSLGYTSEFAVPFIVRICPVPDIVGLPTVVCRNASSFIVTGTPTGGTFSSTTAPSISGTNTATFNPALMTTSGVFTVTYQNFTVPPPKYNCPTIFTKQILIPPPAILLKNVISISASTATDAWPIDGTILSSTKGYGATGIKFMWAPEEDYAYVDDRVQTNTLQTRTDGLLQNVPMFNWKVTSANSCYANWRKINTITQINSGTGQLENRDILNNYSAALYGYNDQLSTAVAANASYKEIAFESFEEYAVGADLKLVSLPKSNLTILTGTPQSTSLAQETNFEYDIIEARNNVITIKYPYSAFSQLTGKRVGVFGAYLTDNSTKNIHGYYDVQTIVAGSVAGTVIITLTDCAILGLWNGKIAIPSKISETTQPAVFVNPSGNRIEKIFAAGIQRKAHSGKQFLKVSANTEMEQVSLRLTPSKKYVISAWVSADIADANTYASGTDRRIEISFLDASGVIISPAVSTDYMFVPSGMIIEGWQRLEGFVTVPANAVRFTLKFATPSGTVTYFDDIRFFPFDGNMETYVYDNINYKLVSVLDQNNYATYYYYDEEGSLYLVKKETELGVQTIQEVYKHSTEINK